MGLLILGNYDQLANIYQPGPSTNQWGQNFTAPAAGTITRLGALVGDQGFEDIQNWTLAVWNPYAGHGEVLAQSALQVETFPNLGGPHVFRREADLLTPLVVTAGQVVRLGWEWVATGLTEIAFGQQAGSGPMYYRSVTSSSVPVTFAGGSDTSGILNAYAFFYPSGGTQMKVRRSNVWVGADVKVRRSGVWVPPTSIKVRRSGGWHDV